MSLGEGVLTAFREGGLLSLFSALGKAPRNLVPESSTNFPFWVPGGASLCGASGSHGNRALAAPSFAACTGALAALPTPSFLSQPISFSHQMLPGRKQPGAVDPRGKEGCPQRGGDSPGVRQLLLEDKLGRPQTPSPRAALPDGGEASPSFGSSGAVVGGQCQAPWEPCLRDRDSPASPPTKLPGAGSAEHVESL